MFANEMEALKKMNKLLSRFISININKKVTSGSHRKSFRSMKEILNKIHVTNL